MLYTYATDSLEGVTMRTRFALVSSLALALLVGCGGNPPEDGLPNRPSNVKAAEADGAITVTWEHDGENTSGYRITRSEAATSSLTRQQAGTVGEVGPDAREFTDLEADVGVKYQYSVVAFGPAGSSSEASLPDTVEVQPGVSLSVGTYIDPISQPDLAIALFTYLDPEELPDSGEVSVKITGPSGWNEDSVLDFKVPVDGVKSGLLWYRQEEAIPGTYSLEVDTGSDVYTDSTSLSSTDVIPLPQNVTLGENDADSVAVSWEPHATAASYTVELFSGSHQSPTYVAWDHTHATEYEFTGLALEPGDYFVAVYAMPVDRTVQHRILPPERFDVSLNATGIFQVQ